MQVVKTIIEQEIGKLSRHEQSYSETVGNLYQTTLALFLIGMVVGAILALAICS